MLLLKIYQDQESVDHSHMVSFESIHVLAVLNCASNDKSATVCPLELGGLAAPFASLVRLQDTLTVPFRTRHNQLRVVFSTFWLSINSCVFDRVKLIETD